MTAGDDSARPLSSSDGGDRRVRRDKARREAVRRQRRRLAIPTLAAIVAIVALVISGVSRGSRDARPSSLAGVPNSIVARASPPHRIVRARAAAPSPGSLPQTHAYPSGRSAELKSLMASLWTGIVHDSRTQALPAFFPKGAYVQLKAIGSAGSDWTDRLVYDYGLDIAAAHALLSPDAASAQLVTVNVPSSYGHWIEPGVCYNSIGYYEMPNARIVYRKDGQIRSFGIASMISWRGVWYVVHLGAILRPTDSGTVDEPASGSGSSAYSGTC
jgi:hypothetical protein